MKTGKQAQKTIKIISVFDNQLQSQLFIARAYDLNQKYDDLQKAKNFKDELHKINTKNKPRHINLFSLRLGLNSIIALSNSFIAKKLLSINIADNFITEYGMHAVKSLLINSQLRYLNLASNMISAAGLEIIVQQLSKNTNLISLDLGVLQGSIRKNSLGAEGAKMIAQILLSNKSLEILKLQDNDLGTIGAQVISKALKQNKKLNYLKIAQNEIKTKGAQQILKHAINLQGLNLGKNFIKPSVGIAIIAFLQVNNRFTRFNLEYNDINMQGINYLKLGLISSRLQYLNIKGNYICDQGLSILLKAFDNSQSKSRQSLEELDISNNQITSKGMLKLKNALMASQLKYLNLSKNMILDEGLIYISQAVEQSRYGLTLIKLQINSCRISDNSMLIFMQKIKSLPNFKVLKCCNNYISEACQKMLEQLMEINHNLLQISLHGNRLSLSCLSHLKNLTSRNKKQTLSIQPNKVKRQLLKIKQQLKKASQFSEKLDDQLKEMTNLKQTRNKLHQEMMGLQRQVNKRNQQFQIKLAKGKSELQKRKEQMREKIENLESLLQKRQNLLFKLQNKNQE